MALSPELRRVNDTYREQNAERSERIFEAPEPAPAPGPSTVQPHPGVVPPARLQPWMRSSKTGRWCVQWNTLGQRKFDRFVQRCETSADLVRFMRDEFRGGEFIRVWRVWYDDRVTV